MFLLQICLKFLYDFSSLMILVRKINRQKNKDKEALP